MSQRGVIFYQTDETGNEWIMNGLVPPLVMEFNVDTLKWCLNPIPDSYPDKVRTYSMTNDRFLLKNCWIGPFVKLSLWNEIPWRDWKFGPLTKSMEAAGQMLRTVYRYYGTHDILYAADFNPSLVTDLTILRVVEHTDATFKMETTNDLNEGTGQTQNCIIVQQANKEAEFYNPIYDKFSGGGVFSINPQTVTINTRVLSDTTCENGVETLKDTISRIPQQYRTRIAQSYMNALREYEKLRSTYDLYGVTAPSGESSSTNVRENVPERVEDMETTDPSVAAIQHESTAGHTRPSLFGNDEGMQNVFMSSETGPTVDILPPIL